MFDAQQAVVCPSRISPSELQAGIFRLSRQFYSASEALRHLIHGRWFDFAIRLRGSFLTRRIERDSASYTRALDKFDQVRADLTAELDKLAEKARTKLREFRNIAFRLSTPYWLAAAGGVRMPLGAQQRLRPQ